MPGTFEYEVQVLEALFVLQSEWIDEADGVADRAWRSATPGPAIAGAAHWRSGSPLGQQDAVLEMAKLAILDSGRACARDIRTVGSRYGVHKTFGPALLAHLSERQQGGVALATTAYKVLKHSILQAARRAGGAVAHRC